LRDDEEKGYGTVSEGCIIRKSKLNKKKRCVISLNQLEGMSGSILTKVGFELEFHKSGSEGEKKRIPREMEKRGAKLSNRGEVELGWGRTRDRRDRA